MPPDLVEDFESLPPARKTAILQAFQGIDADVERRVDVFLSQAVADANGWHGKQALIGLGERRRMVEEVVPLLTSAGAGVGLAVAQGALVAAGVAAGAVSFGIVPVAGVLIGLGLQLAKSEYQHHAASKRLHSGIRQLRKKRREITTVNQQAQQPDNPYLDPEYLTELGSVMDDAGEKINRKYLRVSRLSQQHTFAMIKHSGSPHTKEATAVDKATASGLITQAWKNGTSAKDDSLSLAVLELHFYASTIYQELEAFVDFVSHERTAHLNRMTRLRGHIIRQMHLMGKHQSCGVKCGTLDIDALDQKCQAIAQQIQDGVRQDVTNASAEVDAVRARHQALVAQRASLVAINHADLRAQRDTLTARQAQLTQDIRYAQGKGSTVAHASRQLQRRFDLKDTQSKLALAQQALSAAQADRKAQLQAVNTEIQKTLGELQVKQSTLVGQESVLRQVLNGNSLTATGMFLNSLNQTGWILPTMNTSQAASELAALKVEEQSRGKAAEEIVLGEEAGAAIDYGMDLVMDQIGNAVEKVADKASGVATSVPVGSVVEVSIDLLKDLYENRQLVRRLMAHGRASQTPWHALADQAKQDAMKDLEKIGIDREKLPKIGKRIRHYLAKIAEIDGKIAALQAQVPYSSMFEEKVYANSIFTTCTDAMNAWELCCYKEKQYAKLESSILAFQMLLVGMETKLAGQSHGAVVTPGTLIAKTGVIHKPSYFAKMD